MCCKMSLFFLVIILQLMKKTTKMYVNANNNDLRYQILFVQRVDIKPSKYLHSKFLYHMCFIFFTFSYYP
jgi:hypothetical protein